MTTPTETSTARRPGAGTRDDRSAGSATAPLRPDGTLKVTGEFAYGSDLWMDDMLWGVTLRSPHPYARIRPDRHHRGARDAGVHAVLTARRRARREALYGLELADQPVLAIDVVRYQGEPVALVAADHPETARQAAKKIVVDYEVLDARSVDAEQAAARRPTRDRGAAPAAATWSAT